LGEALAQLRLHKQEQKSISTELPKSPTAGASPVSENPEELAKDPEFLTRAVEEANELAQSSLSASPRSMSFGVHELGQIIISIKEQESGEVTREIPPRDFLDLLNHLREIRAQNKPSRGGLINLNA